MGGFSRSKGLGSNDQNSPRGGIPTFYEQTPTASQLDADCSPFRGAVFVVVVVAGRAHDRVHRTVGGGFGSEPRGFFSRAVEHEADARVRHFPPIFRPHFVAIPCRT